MNDSWGDWDRLKVPDLTFRNPLANYLEQYIPFTEAYTGVVLLDKGGRTTRGMVWPLFSMAPYWMDLETGKALKEIKIEELMAMATSSEGWAGVPWSWGSSGSDR
jgi:hypothetical protein